MCTVEGPTLYNTTDGWVPVHRLEERAQRGEPPGGWPLSRARRHAIEEQKAHDAATSGNFAALQAVFFGVHRAGWPDVALANAYSLAASANQPHVMRGIFAHVMAFWRRWPHKKSVWDTRGCFHSVKRVARGFALFDGGHHADVRAAAMEHYLRFVHAKAAVRGWEHPPFARKLATHLQRVYMCGIARTPTGYVAACARARAGMYALCDDSDVCTREQATAVVKELFHLMKGTIQAAFRDHVHDIIHALATDLDTDQPDSKLADHLWASVWWHAGKQATP